MWFDAPMDGDEARIEELERGFRRDGLPNLVVDYSAAEDVFTRALPFFALVFAVEVVVAVDAELGWTGIGLVAAVLATLVMAFGVMNAVRGQRFFSIPERVDTPELVAFVVLPVLVSFAFGDRRLDALAVLVINSIAHFYTVAHITSLTALKQIDPEFESVSASLKVPFWRTFARVTVPICWPSILDVAVYIFVNALTTVSAVIFLYGPDTKLAAIAIVHMDEMGASAAAAGMATMIVVTALGAKLLQVVLDRVLFTRLQAWRRR